MIQVQQRPEYADFDAQVRQPGLRFLRINPTPSSRAYRRRDYWRKAKTELHRAYLRCAYTSLRIVGRGASVDHYWPKVRYPRLAYEWSNYRLARPRMNRRKGDSEDILDPFGVRNSWFVLDCPSCLIFPGDDLDANTRRQVHSTIRILDLNSDDLVEERCDWLVDLAKGDVSFAHLWKHYPFLAFEIRRQGIEGRLRTLFSVD